MTFFTIVTGSLKNQFLRMNFNIVANGKRIYVVPWKWLIVERKGLMLDILPLKVEENVLRIQLDL